MSKKLFFFEIDVEDCPLDMAPVYASSLKEAKEILESELQDIVDSIYEDNHNDIEEDQDDWWSTRDLERSYRNVPVNLQNYNMLFKDYRLDAPYCNEPCDKSVKYLFIQHMENELKELKAIDTDNSQVDMFPTEESEKYFNELREIKSMIQEDIRKVK